MAHYDREYTKRQELITQLRHALGLLTNPNNESIVFEVDEIEFCYEQDQLEIKVKE